MTTSSNLDAPVSSIASHEVVRGDRSDTVRALAWRMMQSDCGALIIEQRSGLPAIVTERDLVAALAAGGNPDDDWAVDVMTRSVFTVRGDDSIADAVELMQIAGIRHVLVECEDGHQAMLSIRDLLEVMLTTERPTEPAPQAPAPHAGGDSHVVVDDGIRYLLTVTRHGDVVHTQLAANKAEADLLELRFSAVPHTSVEVETIHDAAETNLAAVTQKIVDDL